MKFIDEIDKFTRTVDIVTSHILKNVWNDIFIEEVKNHFKKQNYQLGYCELLGQKFGRFRTYPSPEDKEGLKTICNDNAEDWNAPILSEKQYIGHVSFAFHKNQKLWLCGVEGKFLYECERSEIKDYWSNNDLSELPRYTDVGKEDKTRTSILIPLIVDNNKSTRHCIGILNFEFVNDFKPTQEIKEEFEQIAEVITRLYELNRIYEQQTTETIERIEKLSKELESQKDNLGTLSNSPLVRYDLGILTTTEVEWQQLQRAFPELKRYENFDGVEYFTCDLSIDSHNKSKKIVAARLPEMGMIAASVSTIKLIDQFHPHFLAMTGIAAGVKEKVNFGDILIADRSWNYGSGKITESNGIRKFHPDTDQLSIDTEIRSQISVLRSNEELLHKIRQNFPTQERPDTVLKAHIGHVASGAAVLESLSDLELIKSHQRNLLGIDMEIYGMYYAADNYSTQIKPKTFAIKSVSDFADTQKNDKCQEYASWTSAAFLRAWIYTQLDENILNQQSNFNWKTIFT